MIRAAVRWNEKLDTVKLKEINMEIDARLEELSDKIRKGEPVGMLEAIEAINYQETLRAERQRNTPWARFVRWLSA